MQTKSFIVTGAAGGIGYAVAESLLAQGANLVLFDANTELLQHKASALQHQFPQQTIYSESLDIQDEAAVDKAIDSVVETLTNIDGLVHAAATLTAGSLVEMTSDEFQSIMMTNVIGSFHVLKRVARQLKTQQKGAIVVVGSNSATSPRLNIGAYGASKAAVHMLVKNFALELSSANIRCNLVSPGSTRTEMLVKTWHSGYGESETIQGDQSTYRLGIPLGKIAEPRDVANAVSFLLSDAANHITMHDLRVDGGATLNQMG